MRSGPVRFLRRAGTPIGKRSVTALTSRNLHEEVRFMIAWNRDLAREPRESHLPRLLR
jgi:hypothetical protein